MANPDRSQRRPEEALQLARRAVNGVPTTATYYNTLGLAEVRNLLWDEAIATLNKSAEMNKGADPTDFSFLALAHWGRGNKAEADQFFQRGVDGAHKNLASQPEWRMFWAEAAKLLGKPAPPAAARQGLRLSQGREGAQAGCCTH
jgi:tetratricopeptide (TPR) repeat protein